MSTITPSPPFTEVFSSQDVAAAVCVFLLSVIVLAPTGVRSPRPLV